MEKKRLNENLSLGYYNVTMIYNGNAEYNEAKAYTSFRVGGTNDPNLSIHINDIYEGESSIVEVRGDYRFSGEVTIFSSGFYYSYGLRIFDGCLNTIIDEFLPLGNHPVYVKFEGNDCFKPSNASTSYNVMRWE